MELFSDLHNKEVLADKLIKIGLLNVKMNFVKLEQKTRIVSHHLKAEIKVLTQQQSDEFLHFFFLSFIFMEESPILKGTDLWCQKKLSFYHISVS